MTVPKDCKFQKPVNIFCLPEFYVTTGAARTNKLKLTSAVSYSKGETLPFAGESIQNWDFFFFCAISLFSSIRVPESDSRSTSAAVCISLQSKGSPGLTGSLLFTVFSLWQVITGRLQNNSAELPLLFIANI